MPVQVIESRSSRLLIREQVIRKLLVSLEFGQNGFAVDDVVGICHLASTVGVGGSFCFRDASRIGRFASVGT